MLQTYRTPILIAPALKQPWWTIPFRPFAQYLYPLFGNSSLFRRIHGGKWERRYVEPCWSTLWLRCDEFGRRLPLEGPCEALEEWP